jgi:uncharacterized membrane protein (DUF373 family)
LSTQERVNKIIQKIEVTAVTALELLVAAVVVIATIILFLLLLQGLRNEVTQIESIETFLAAMQKSFAGVLTVVLALELLETLKAYFNEHRIRLEVILIVATIAAGRHVLEIDFEHTSGIQLLGFASVIVSLTLGYFLVKKAQRTGEEIGREPLDKS